MHKQIVKLAVHQSSKVVAILHFLVGFIYLIPLVLLLYFSTGDASFFGYLILPFVFLVLGYIGYVIIFWLYNLVAGSFGGIEIELSDVEEDVK